MFHKKADKNIIQNNTDQYQAGNNGKAEPVHADTEPGKYHMTHQHKAGRKTNEKGYDKCSNMGLESDEIPGAESLYAK